MTTNNAKGAADGDEKYKNASYYGEDIFDDLIAEALDSSQHGDAGPERSTAEPRVVDITPSKKSRRRRSVDDDGDDDDAASLDSEEISGGSDVSEVEKERNMYAPPPLINDDESTVDMRPPAPQSQTVSSYVDQLNRTERSKGRLIRAGAFAIVIAIVVGVILAVVSLGGGRKDGGGSSSVQASTPRGPPVTQTASTVATTLVPTAGPVILTPIETIHPLKLTFQNIPAGYRLPEDHRASIIGYIGELLEDYLSGEFELLEVAYARQGGGGGNQRTIIGGSPPSRALRTSQPSQRRRLLSFALPLRIVLRGPPTFSEDFVRSYLVEEMNDQSTYIGNYLKAFDWETYKNVRISAEIYDFADLIEPTMSPSLPPQTRSPSLSPSMRPQTRTPTTSPLLSPETRSPTVSPSRSPNVAKLLNNKAPNHEVACGGGDFTDDASFACSPSDSGTDEGADATADAMAHPEADADATANAYVQAFIPAYAETDSAADGQADSGDAQTHESANAEPNAEAGPLLPRRSERAIVRQQRVLLREEELHGRLEHTA
eukprot:CAMPEP_0172542604 /NCGR_PEP_ID=MMETSP1067-20121228/13176_1 /TAXON_ID=265564 ORGANISM="Thalassiosira punctigera, Strain Tpunct2005C2" /NCGR_SAMPLE_ID=MMETSP1067 /ASSEMBLY_ACC=CAM_ASM_000444 /LENGTH=544 /DNA_ID=CAMNT_0013328879 /DNA_START=46 /DNA_END=1679 /DNA_ORIENTATION=+